MYDVGRWSVVGEIPPATALYCNACEAEIIAHLAGHH